MPRDDVLHTLNIIGSALHALVDHSDYRFAVFVHEDLPRVLFTTRSLALLLRHDQSTARGLTFRQLFAVMPELADEIELNLPACRAGSTTDWWMAAPDPDEPRQQCLMIPFPREPDHGCVFAMSEIGTHSEVTISAADAGKAAMETLLGLAAPAPARLTPADVGCSAAPKVMRSVVLADGSRTSIRMEEEFWTALTVIAREQDAPLSEIMKVIDGARGTASRASAVRTYVLNYLFRSVYEPVLA